MNDSKVVFHLSRKVKTPARGTSQSAGIDFFIPEYDETFVKDFLAKNTGSAAFLTIMEPTGDAEGHFTIDIPPHERVNIPSGVHVYMEPKSSALIAANKSGVSTKKGLVFTCQVVDSDYTGEIHMGVVNTSNETVTLKSGEKLIQFIHTPVYFSDLFQIVGKEDYEALHKGSERGDGAFGSTGTN